MNKTFDDILSDFNTNDPTKSKPLGAPVTIWIPAEDKARYDRLQKSSGRQFSKKARMALLALIQLAEARTA